MKNKGFTLIELLVVISIIALLSSIVLASLNTARDKARGSALVQSIKQVQLALELYREDNGTYPKYEPSGGCEAEGGNFANSNPFCIYDAHTLLGNELLPYLNTDSLLGLSSSNPGILYSVDYSALSVWDYPCGNAFFSTYVIGIPKFNASGALIDLPLPLDASGAAFAILRSTNNSDFYYCLGV